MWPRPRWQRCGFAWRQWPWRGFAGQPGFYLPAPVVTDNVHPTNATGRLLEFYTAETAAVVAATYADDFAYFGYCATFACLAAGGVG